MRYKLTIIDKLYLSLTRQYANKYAYIHDKVEKYSIKYFTTNNISFPIYFDKYLESETKTILKEYEWSKLC